MAVRSHLLAIVSALVALPTGARRVEFHTESMSTCTTIDCVLMGLPKTDLHMHIEGSLEPEMALDLAKKHAMLPLRVPRAEGGYIIVNTLAELKEVYKFKDLVSFLNVYNLLATTLKDAEDFENLAYSFMQHSAAQGTIYSEIFFDPQTHTARGLNFSMVASSLFKGIKRGEEEFGTRAEMICSILRDHPVGNKLDKATDVLGLTLNESTATAWATVQQCVAFNEAGGAHGKRLIAVGIDNAEVSNFLPGHVVFKGTAGFPPNLFKEQYNYAKSHGMSRTAHAGEEGPPSWVWDAIKNLSISRIDHGVRSVADPLLIQYLVEQALPLTVCPRSNFKLKVFPIPSEMNLLSLLDQNVLASVNSDDPAYFGGYAGDQFTFVVEKCGSGAGCGSKGTQRRLTAEDVRTLAINGFKSSFALSKDEIQSYVRQVDDYIALNEQVLKEALAMS